MIALLSSLLAVSAFIKHEGEIERKLIMVGGCDLKGPGAVQVPAGVTDGSVKGQAPHTAVYKDGFWMVGCYGDEMVTKGDKFGNGAMAYETGAVANTSIVRYDVVVERENQKPMTPRVCFDFCRSIPEMTFFGLHAGRDCYCEHFYKTTTGGGSCDLPCDGDNGAICGGQVMSTIYQMHACVGGFAQDVSDLQGDTTTLYDNVELNRDAIQASGNAMQASGEKLESFAEGSASPLSQAAKVAAGPVVHAAEDLTELLAEFDTVKDNFAGAAIDPAGDLTHHERKVVEDMMEHTKEIMDASEQALAAAKALHSEAAPTAEGADAGSTFVPVLRQIDAELQAKMSVCGGESTGMPKVGLSYDQCAQACDSEFPKSSDEYCWAFQFFSFPDADALCFLFKDVTELTSYSCDYEAAPAATEFLQRKHHKKHHHGHHGKKHGLVRKAEPEVEASKVEAPKVKEQDSLMLSHPSTRYLLQSVKLQYNGGASRSGSPQAMCAVRFADVNGVTPDMKDGMTNIERCFAAEA